MAQGRVVYRRLFYAAAAPVLLMAQDLFLNGSTLWGVHPLLPPLAVATVAVWQRRQESLCASAAFGLLCDLWMPGLIPCYFFLSFTLTAFFIGALAPRRTAPGLFRVTLWGAAALAINSLPAVLIFACRDRGTVPAALVLAGKELILSVPLTVPVYVLLLPIRRRFDRGMSLSGVSHEATSA